MKAIRPRLTDDEVRQIRGLIDLGWRHYAIAKVFCVYQSTITRIASGEAHADVLDDAERKGPCRCRNCLIAERRQVNLDLIDDAMVPVVCVHCGGPAGSAPAAHTQNSKGHVVCGPCRRKS